MIVSKMLSDAYSPEMAAKGDFRNADRGQHPWMPELPLWVPLHLKR